MRKIQQFMSKRCGIDELNLLFLFLSVLSYFVYVFLPMDKKIFSCLVLLLFLVLCIYRMFSANLEWRKKENAVFLKFCDILIPEEKEEKKVQDKKTNKKSFILGKKETAKKQEQDEKKDDEKDKIEPEREAAEKEEEKSEPKQNVDDNYVYFNCPYCNQAIRIPKKQGKVKITCPTCKNKFIKET